MASIIQEGTVLSIRPGVDITTLNLTAQEGYLLSRIDGKLTVREIYQVSLMDRVSTAAVLKRFTDDGLLQTVEASGRLPSEADQNTMALPHRDFQSYIFNLVEIGEDVELSPELRKDILFVYNNLENMNYYELMAISSTANLEEIKSAFLNLSKLYHPDSYFRKNIGAYKERLTAIYSKLTEAHRTLTDPELTLPYRQQLIQEGAIEPSPMDRNETPQEREKRHQKDTQERRARQNPMMSRVLKAKTFYEAGLTDLEKQAWISAANNFKMAITYDPYNELYQAKAEQVKLLANRATADRLFQRAQMLESYGQDGYFEAYQKAAELCPNVADFTIKVARMYWDQGDYKDALPYARKAAQVESKNPEYRLLMAKILLRLKQKEEAIKHIESVMKIDPSNSEAQAILKDAKKWF